MVMTDANFASGLTTFREVDNCGMSIPIGMPFLRLRLERIWSLGA
jgi:hypothetical protein